MSRVLLILFLAASTAFAQQTVVTNGVPSQSVTLSGDPTSNLQPSTKQYADYRNSTVLATYSLYVSGGTTYAVNNATTNIDYSNTDSAVVINRALSAMATTGGTLYFKNGTYNLNSCTLETVSPYTTLCYAVGVPSGTGTNFPNFNFVGESSGIGSQANPATSGVIFNVTSTAITAAGTGTLTAFWMRPNITCNAQYQALTSSCLYWNGHLSFTNLAINFPDNTRGNEYGIDAIESSYLHLDHVQAGFVTFPSALGASNLTAFKTPATPSDGVLIQETQVGPGWDIGYEVNTEHSILSNTEAWKATTCYVYGGQVSRNNSITYHSSQFIHPQVYDCKYGVTTGSHLAAGAQLDIFGLDDQYATTGNWTQSYAFDPGTALGGFLSWGDISDAGAVAALTSPFGSTGHGAQYAVERNGSLSANGGAVCPAGTPTITFTTGSGSLVPGATNCLGAVLVNSSGALDFTLNWKNASAATYSYPNTSNCAFSNAAKNSDTAKEVTGNNSYVEGWGSTSAVNEYVTYICGGN